MQASSQREAASRQLDVGVGTPIQPAAGQRGHAPPIAPPGAGGGAGAPPAGPLTRGQEGVDRVITDQAGQERDLTLRRLLLVRIVTATALLLAALSLQLLVGTERSLAPIYWLITALYTTSLVYTLMRRPARRWHGFTGAQLTVDVALVTMLVYALGGVRSPFVLVYLIIAFGAGTMLQQQVALGIAAWTGVCYGLMAHLASAGWLPNLEIPFGPGAETVDPAEMYLRIFAVLLGSCFVAAVSSSSATRLRRTRYQLQQERTTLEAVQQLNQQLLAGMSSGLIAADSGGKVVACNRAAERITGRSREHIVGHPVSEILDLDPGAFADLERRLRERQIYRTERQIQDPSGASRTVGMSVTRVTEEPVLAAGSAPGNGTSDSGRSPGGPWAVRGEGPIAGGYIFMFQDLTDIKRMERLFWMRERMAVLGEMASSLAHEIRNPLASISGSLQMLRHGDVEMQSVRGGRLMDIVTKESERLSHIIEDFLDYARPEKLEANETDLVAIARDTVDLLGNSPEIRSDHELEVEAAQEPVMALVDAGRIKQVFWNLARNAVQAMPEGGSLRIRLIGSSRGARVVFEDSGVGMSTDQVDNVFRPFVSGSDSGTGLGLAIVYRIMELHGARIEVESENGKGTRFVLHFEDAAVPGPGEQTVVVEGQTERGTRLFDELSRSIQAS